MERPAGGTKAKRFALPFEYRYYPSCRDLSICQNMPEISAPRPQMDFMCFFVDEKHIASGFATRRNVELPSWTARQEVELEPIEILASREKFPRSFRISVVFFVPV